MAEPEPTLVKITPGRGRGSTTDYQVWCPGCERLHTIDDHTAYGWRVTNAEDPEHLTIRPSIKVTFGERGRVCHSFIRDGHWDFLADSTHSLAGQRVPLQPIPEEWL